MFFNLFRKKISITYGITVCNEYVELDELLQILISNINSNDEIIVLQDITHENKSTSDVIFNYKKSVKHIKAKLNNDFSTFKNNLIENAVSDYLFQIDADEIPKVSLLKKIKKILSRKSNADCFLVPRINTVDGLTTSYIEKWNWQIDKNNRINYPDYQFRILKLNGCIKWKNKVHEELYGYKKNYYLPHKNESFCLIHHKSIGRQVMQNNFYDNIVNNN